MRSRTVHRTLKNVDRPDPLRVELLAAELELWEIGVDAHRLEERLPDIPAEEAKAAIAEIRSQLDRVEALLG